LPLTELHARPRTRVAQNAPAAGGAKASSVAKLLDRAREMFDDQRYEESIQTLSGALVRPGTSVAERIEVYKLLAFNYITLGKSEESDAAVRALLVLDENFELPKSESPRFREVFEKTKKAWEEEGKPGKVEEGTPGVEKTPIKMTHATPAQVEQGTAIKIEGKVDDPDARVERVDMHYRSGDKGKFVKAPLVFSMGAFRGQIPTSAVTPPLVEYYLLALDKDGLPVAARGDADAPVRVVVPEDDSTVFESPWFWIPVGVAVVGGAILTGVLVSELGGETTATSTIRVNVGE
jgi:hypothetical protein